MIRRILVCVKLVPTTSEILVDGQYLLKREGANLQLNIADCSAIEAALQMKTADPAVEITVLSMGPSKSEAMLQELFALGIDQVVLLTDRAFAGADSLATTRVLASAIRNLGGYDCILCGRRAMDAETGQIPGQLAAALDIPLATNVQQVVVQEDGVICERRLENGIIKLKIHGPCLLSLCEYAYTLRLPSIMGRRKAKSMSVTKMTASDVDLEHTKCGLSGSVTKVIQMDSKSAGLRQCSYCEAKTLAEIIREVQL